MNPYLRWRDSVSGLALDIAELAPFDTETTGLGPFGVGQHRLVSIAVLHATIGGDAPVLALHELCYPERGIDPAATAVHGISTEQIERAFNRGQAALFWNIRRRVEAAFRDRIPVAHNLPFDAAVLRGELRRPAPGPEWVPPGLCTQSLAWAAWPHAPNHGLAAMYELVTGSHIERHHEADADALACFRVLQGAVAALRERAPVKTVGDLLAAQDQGSIKRRAARAAHGEG